MTNCSAMRTGGRKFFLLAVVAFLAMAPTASAVQTDQYDAFSACPTDAPALNDPSNELAICASGVAHGGVLKIDGLSIPISRFEVQFGATGFSSTEPECPAPGFCFGRAAGTTTVESPPSSLRLNPSGHSHEKGNGEGLGLKIAIESAGDIRAVSPGFLFEAPVPLYKLPIKLHLKAPWLGKNCYVGSNVKPIFSIPFVVGPPASVDFLADPNGFNAEVITLTGLPLLDKTLALPAANGCDQGQGAGSEQADALASELLGLPSPAGANQMVLTDTDIAFAAAGFDGSPPDGGAELRAAFDAAQ